jgi:hypothetical protein
MGSYNRRQDASVVCLVDDAEIIVMQCDLALHRDTLEGIQE